MHAGGDSVRWLVRLSLDQAERFGAAHHQASEQLARGSLLARNISSGLCLAPRCGGCVPASDLLRIQWLPATGKRRATCVTGLTALSRGAAAAL